MKSFLEKFKISYSIRAKLISAFLILILLPILIVTIYSTVSMARRAKQEVLTRVSSNGAGAWAMLDAEIKKYDLMCLNMVNDNSIRIPMQMGVISQLTEYGQLLSEKKRELDEIGLYLADGRKVFSKWEDFDFLVNRVLDSGQPFSGIVNVKGLCIVSVNIVNGNPGSQDKVAGAVLLVHNLSSDKQFVKEISTKLNSYAMLYQGTSLKAMAGPSGDEVFLSKPEDRQLADHKIFSRDRYLIEDSIKLDTSNYFVLFQTLRDIDGKPAGGIAVGENDHELKVKIFETVLIMALVFALFSGVSIAVAVFVSGLLTRPILNLKRYMEAVEEGVLDIRSEYKATDEIGTLHSSFNRMVNELSDSQDRLERAQEIAHVGNWEFNPETGIILGTKEVFCIFGIKRDASLYISLQELMAHVHPKDREQLPGLFGELVYGKHSFDAEFEITREDNQAERIIHGIAALDRNGGSAPKRVLGVFQDVTRQKQYELELKQKHEELTAVYEELVASEEELHSQYDKLVEQKLELEESRDKIKYLAYYDSLTSLPNRANFIKRLDEAIEQAVHDNRQCAILFLDMDNFKKINDTMGHTIGDKLLIEAANRLSSCISGKGVVSRFGGDEFLILLREVYSLEDIGSFINRLLTEFEKPWNVERNEFYVTVSIGVAVYPGDGLSYEELLKNADTAMYMAKSLGKNNYQHYDASMKNAVEHRLSIEKGLRKAIKNNEFLLHYQAQIDVKSGKVRGFEALIRWESREFGLVSPVSFIPVAEDVGLIVQMGEWVLRTACRQNKQWQDEGFNSGVICVNVSAKQLKQGDFVDRLKQILEETGLEPQYLELEITESMLIESFEKTVRSLEELRKMGVNISLDDFGTGYSSLNYLKMLPITMLKIDKSFIYDLNKESIERTIIDLIIPLVHKMNIKVVAEGVENKGQLKYLSKCDCDLVQGYLLCKPLPAEKLKSFMEKNQFDFNWFEWL